MAVKEPLPAIKFIPREAFLEDYWQYKAGEHATFLAPTQSGKTTLMTQLAKVTATPRLPAVTLVMKPRDAVATKMAKDVHLQVIRSWPPSALKNPLERRKYNGWLLWPKHTFDTDVDDAHLQEEFRKALRSSYKQGDRIVIADETVGLVKELKLEKELNAIWTRGASMGCGLWAATQRPAFIPLNAYSQSEHMFLAFDPDTRAQERYGEIGGVDPKLIQATVAKLPKYHWLYIRRTGRVAAVIGA